MRTLWQTRAHLDNGHLDGYLSLMSEYSVAEAKNHLPKLIDRALAGEEVTITRRGKVLVKLVMANPPPVECADAPRTFNDIEWLKRHQVETSDSAFDSAALIRAMRDDYRY
ncbi:MAG TPA: type II toxin-antitoxin system prevent-host-death family antitoxin [Caulobacteraceae bacterium]|jgi:prevent-host-death family protein